MSVSGGPQRRERGLLTRRAALRIGAGAAATLGAASGARPAWARNAGHGLPLGRRLPGELPDPMRPMGEPSMHEIEHIVLLMLENHSADNVLGLLGHRFARRRREFLVFGGGRRDFDGLPVDRHGVPNATNPDGKGGFVRSFALPDVCPSAGLTQNWNSSHRQFDAGRNDGFVTNSGSPTPMGFLTREQMPITYALARHFPVSDRYFSSVLGQTLPNRRYYFSATSSGQVNDDIASLFVPAAGGTIFDRLDATGVAWQVYFSNAPSPFYFPNVRNNASQVSRCVNNSRFFTDAATGQLPAISYVEEDFTFQSEENPQDIAFGEAFLSQVVKAVMQGPLWRKTALFVTYDEHGGWYDHVPPPAAITPDDIPPNLTLSPKGTFPASFDRYGFRVPLTVVSPWARPRYVSHRTADHTSILAFIERKWNLPPMTRRDAAAWDLIDMFDFTFPHHERPIELPPTPDIESTLRQCRADGENPPTGPTATSLLKHFVRAV
jgi:phospholipase C